MSVCFQKPGDFLQRREHHPFGKSGRKIIVFKLAIYQNGSFPKCDDRGKWQGAIRRQSPRAIRFRVLFSNSNTPLAQLRSAGLATGDIACTSAALRPSPRRIPWPVSHLLQWPDLHSQITARFFLCLRQITSISALPRPATLMGCSIISSLYPRRYNGEGQRLSRFKNPIIAFTGIRSR